VSGGGKREKRVECRALNAAINEGEREVVIWDQMWRSRVVLVR
jgi:hypothetical protein